MAGESTKQKLDQEQAQDQTIRQRSAIQNAYASLLGEQNNQTFAAFTLEEALDAQIERIAGKGSDAHPNQLDRVARIKNQLLQAVDEVSKTDPAQYEQVSVDKNVNT